MLLTQINRAFIAFSRFGVLISFAVLIGVVLIQIIGRTIGSSPVWTEELTRFALLYLVAFGTGLSLISGDLANVDVLCDAMPGKWPFRLRLFSTLATGLMCAILIMPAWKFTSIGRIQTSPALGLRMHYIHASVLLLLVFLSIFALLRVIDMLRGETDGRSQKFESRL